MADLANSTRTPSRRALLSIAAASATLGSVTGLRIAVAAEADPDAAILALSARAAQLIEASDRLWHNVDAADELIEEMTRPVPAQPGGPGSYGMPTERFADAMRRYEAERATYDARHAQISERVNREGLEAAAYAADEAMSDTCLELAKMRATTLGGLVAKARVAGSYNRAGLRDSIVADIIAMGA